MTQRHQWTDQTEIPCLMAWMVVAALTKITPVATYRTCHQWIAKLSSSFTCACASNIIIFSYIWLCSFIFTLQEFAKELTALIEATSRIYAAEKAVAASSRWSRMWRVFTRFTRFLRDTLSFRRLCHRQDKPENVPRPGLRRRLCEPSLPPPLVLP